MATPPDRVSDGTMAAGGSDGVCVDVDVDDVMVHTALTVAPPVKAVWTPAVGGATALHRESSLTSSFALHR